ncbi:hypothetical protein BGZ83_011100 [Gryganskiella cystojenkinii]|nr:hypothetical protein BGZ83_011100 [Gryganskiella cystojenkinii]
MLTRSIYSAGAVLEQDDPLSQSSSVSSTTLESQQQDQKPPSLTITSFLTPPGTEKHHSPYETIADSLKAQKTVKDESEALWDRTPIPVSTQTMMLEAVRSGSPKQVWHTYKRLRRKTGPSHAPQEGHFSSFLYFTMLHCLQRSRMAESSKWASTIYEEMSQLYTPKIQTLNTLLDIYVRHEDLDTALEFFKKETTRFGAEPNVRSYNIMLRGLTKNHRLTEAVKMYDQMRSGVIPVRPDITTYSTLVGAYTQKHMPDEADLILTDMFADKVKPNMWIFNTAIKRLVTKKDYSNALKVLELMANEGLKPDVVTYSTLIDGYARDGNEEAIAKIQAEMAVNGIYPNAKTITSTIKVFARSGLDSEIDTQLEDVIRSLPTGEMNDLTLGVLMNVYGKRKDLEAARMVYDHIATRGRPVNDVIVNSLLDGYVRANDLPTANKLFHDHFTVRHQRPTTSLTYSIMISGCCKQGNLRDALHYYHEMNLHRIEPDSIVCSRLIQLYLQHHQLENAQQMLRLMRNTSMEISVHTFTMMIDYLSSRYDNKGALKTYQQMIDLGVQPDAHCFTVLINAHLRAKNFAACDRTYQQMIKAGIQPTIQTYTSMIQAHSQQKNLGKLKEYWVAMTGAGLFPDIKAFTLLMQTYGQQGNIEMVEFIYKEIQHNNLPVDAITMATLSSAYTQLPSLNTARLDSIWSVIVDRELEPTPEYFRQMVDAYGSHGLPDRVIKTWKLSQGLSGSSSWVPSKSNLLHLIEACRDRGYLDTLHSVWHIATVGPSGSAPLTGHSNQKDRFPENHSSIPGSNTQGHDRFSRLDYGDSNDSHGEDHPRVVIKRPEPEVFTAYLNALLTHNRFQEIETLLDEGCTQMRTKPRQKDLELLFTGLAQYSFLEKELSQIRSIVVRKWPTVEPVVDTIIRDTRKI